MNHPDFRLGGRIFATLGVPDDDWGMVKLTPEQQRTLIAEKSTVFKACNGAWGRRGATHVYLPLATASVVRAALDLAVANVGSRQK